MIAAIQDVLNRGVREVGPALAGGAVLIGLILVTINRFEADPDKTDPLDNSVLQDFGRATSPTTPPTSNPPLSTATQFGAVDSPTIDVITTDAPATTALRLSTSTVEPATTAGPTTTVEPTTTSVQSTTANATTTSAPTSTATTTTATTEPVTATTTTDIPPSTTAAPTTDSVTSTTSADGT